MKKILILLLLPLLLIGCQKKEKAYFVITENGIEEEYTDKENKKLEWYTDAYCPDCIRAHEDALPSLLNLVGEGKIEIKIHPLNFLPDKTPDDYSLRAATWILGISKVAPDKTLIAMKEIMGKTRPKQGATTNDSIFEEAAERAGVKEIQRREIKKSWNTYEQAIQKASDGIRERKDLKQRSIKEDKRFFVPFIYLNEEGNKTVDGESKDKNDILNPILESLTDNIGPCKEGCE